MKNFEKYIDEIITTEKLGQCAICKTRKLKCTNLKMICDARKIENKQWLLSEYVEPIVLTRFEYDLIDTNDQSHDRAFNSFATYRNMMDRGYFENIKDTSMTLKEILDNCEIIKENQR